MSHDTMAATRDVILDDLVALLGELTRDWDRAEAIGADTWLFADLGFQSLDVVVLATSLQERYRREMPFAALFAEVGQRDVRDLSVGEMASFLRGQVVVDGKE